jgi:mannose-6-phosphate isomerase
MARSPFTLDVALLAKAWGGRRLGALYGDPRDHLGEAWLCADLAQTAQSGAGGQAMISVVLPPEGGAATARDASASAAVHDLHAALRLDPLGLLGFHAERFPLLVKFLDAAEHLSVQVHPSPAYARAHPGAHVKSEAWVVLEAEPGAELMLGLDGIPDGSALATAARDDSLPDRLVRVPATPGTACWLPSGLVHALGAGSLVFEVQTASDTTYRLYDWTGLYGRAPRAMHIEAGVEAALLDAAPVWGPSLREAESGPILATPDFEIGAVAGPSEGPASGPLSTSSVPRALLVVPVGGAAHLTGPWGRLEAPAHRVTVVPAAAVADCRLELPAGTRAFLVRVLGVEAPAASPHRR